MKSLKATFLILLLASVFILQACVSSVPGAETGDGTGQTETESSPANETGGDGTDSGDEHGTVTQVSPPEPVFTNIAVGKKYTVSAESFRTDSMGDSSDKTGTELKMKMTDGLTASTGESGKICGYYGRDVILTLDLGGMYTVRGVSVDLYSDGNAIPALTKASVSYYYSQDGEHFIYFEKLDYSDESVVKTESGDWERSVFSAGFDSGMHATHIRVVYSFSGRTIRTSEIEVEGCDSLNVSTDEAIPAVFLSSSTFNSRSYTACEVTMIDPTGRYGIIHDENATQKIRGNSTSSGAKKPYNIKFENKTNVFGMGKAKKWNLLANLYDKTQMRNSLSFSLAETLGLEYTSEYRYVQVYLNGNYNGLYWLCESVGVGSTRVDIDIENGDFLLEEEAYDGLAQKYGVHTPIYKIVLGIEEPEVPTSEQRDSLKSFFYTVEAAIQSKNYSQISKIIDIKSFVDYYIIQEFFKQVDFGVSSTRYYIKDGVLYAGPVWDFDLTAGNYSSSYYTWMYSKYNRKISYEGYRVKDKDYWYGYLFECKEFAQAVKTRYEQVLPWLENLYKDNSLGGCAVDVLYNSIRREIRLNYSVWKINATYSGLEKKPAGTYEGEIKFLKSWFEERNKWLMKEFGIGS